LTLTAHVASIFPNAESIHWLVTAILMEISEDWEAGRIYLNMGTE